MSKEDWSKNPVHKILDKSKLWPFSFTHINSVLDVGCGLALKSQHLRADVTLGIDMHEPYLRKIESIVPYTVIKYDILKLDDIILDNSFEIVYIIDVIEHLEKNESIKLMEVCKRKCSKAVVIETPQGYIPQNLDIQGFNAHHLQTHRCGWFVYELQELGFMCTTRDYTMNDVKRHTTETVDPNIKVIDAIYIKENK